MQVVQMPIGQVIPYARNPRKNDAAVAKVAASIKEFGWQQPIVVDEHMVVIAGHTRLLAARQLGQELVPVRIATELNPVQVKAFRITDNKTHEAAEWDNELLALELSELKESDFDLELTGFDVAELEELRVLEGALGSLYTGSDEDAEPEPPAEPVSKPGDIWILGRHRLLCGDALNVKSYALLLEGSKADMVFTDPPYNVNYAGSGRFADRQSADHYKILNDNLPKDFYEFLYTASKRLMDNCRGAIYITMSSGELGTLHRAFKAAGGYWSTFIIWVKNHFALSMSDYQRKYEPILYGWPNGQTHFWCGARDQSDVWFFNKPDSSPLHPTMKPVELVAQAIQNSTLENGTVLDSFGGSGSTLIACEKTKRMARMIELDPKYCDVIIQRWQDFSGQEATLLETGKTFSEIKAATNQATINDQ